MEILSQAVSYAYFDFSVSESALPVLQENYCNTGNVVEMYQCCS